jgi:hypothetical protein
LRASSTICGKLSCFRPCSPGSVAGSRKLRIAGLRSSRVRVKSYVFSIRVRFAGPSKASL